MWHNFKHSLFPIKTTQSFVQWPHCLKVHKLRAICFLLGQVKTGLLLVRQCKLSSKLLLLQWSFLVTQSCCRWVCTFEEQVSLTHHISEWCHHPLVGLIMEPLWCLRLWALTGLFFTLSFSGNMTPFRPQLAFRQIYTSGSHKRGPNTRNFTLPSQFLSLSNTSRLCFIYRLSIYSLP